MKSGGGPKEEARRRAEVIIIYNFIIFCFTISTPLGDTKMPLPMIDPTMTVTPFRRVILGLSSIVSFGATVFSPLLSLSGSYQNNILV